MRVLAVSPRIPFPPIDGAGMRTSHLLRALSERHEVTLVAFDYGGRHEPPGFPVELLTVPWEWPEAYRAMREGDAAESQRAVAELSAEDGEPWFVSCVASPDFAAAIRRASRGGVDVVVLEETAMGRFMPELQPGCPVVLDLHNVHARIARRAAELDPGQQAEAERTRRFESHLARRCSLLLVVSDLEAVAARELLGADQDRVRVVPNGVDTEVFQPAAGGQERGRVLFVGRMDYEPNVDAVLRFAADVWPAVREQAPWASFHVVGPDPVAEVEEIACEDVIVHGLVEDVRSCYASAEVFVAPLRSGGGTRLKLLEAAASGLPIVTTSVGMEGLRLRPGRDLVVADEAVDIATAVAGFLEDAERRAAFGRSARRGALGYDWSAIGADFRSALEDARAAPLPTS
jgi:glycosyltransferase involved in cell wall biosynthesis